MRQKKPQIEVLYEDKDLVAIAKPPRLLTHRTEISNGDQFFALQLTRDLLGKKVWPVYRLDRGTSGVLLFAFAPDIVTSLSEQPPSVFQKRYIAVARGFVPSPLHITHALRPPVDPYLRVQKTEPQEADTLFMTLATGEVPVPSGNFSSTRLSLVRAELRSGRRHQIRRHLKFSGHPIIGDATYGKGPLNRALAEYFGFDRLMLHCVNISFKHPVSGEVVRICQRPTDDLLRLLERMRWCDCLSSDEA